MNVFFLRMIKYYLPFTYIFYAFSNGLSFEQIQRNRYRLHVEINCL